MSGNRDINASAIILTRDSAETLPRTLRSVARFREILVVDGSSTDATCRLAQAAGARVIPQPAGALEDGRIRDYAAVRNAALAAATERWVFMIDADEELSPEATDDIARIAREATPAAYAVPRRYLIGGRRIEHSITYPNFQTRFFHRDAVERYVKAVHERPLIRSASKTRTLTGILLVPQRDVLWDPKWDRYLAMTEAAWQRPSISHAVRQTWSAMKLWTLYTVRWLRYLPKRGAKAPWRYEVSYYLYNAALVGYAWTRILSPRAHRRPRPARHASRAIHAIANVRMPTEKAHGRQIMEMCAAFAAAGRATTLVVPARTSPIMADPFGFYGLAQSFTIRRVPVLDLIPYERTIGRIAFWIERLTFACSALAVSVRAEAFWTRDEFVALRSLVSRVPLAYEAHAPSGRAAWIYRLIARRGRIIAISTGVAEALVALGVPRGRISVIPDGVSLERFAPTAKADARQRIGLPTGDTIILYSGHLYGWKGVETLAEASVFLPNHVRVLVAGGTASDSERFRLFLASRPDLRVEFLGFRPPAEVPTLLAAADVLVLPTSGKTRIGAEFTSPLKLFEYMAAERPIVATDLPSHREALRHGENAHLVAPDDPRALADGITALLTDPVRSAALARAAHEAVKRYSWDARARAVLALLEGVRA